MCVRVCACVYVRACMCMMKAKGDYGEKKGELDKERSGWS